MYPNQTSEAPRANQGRDAQGAPYQASPSKTKGSLTRRGLIGLAVGAASAAVLSSIPRPAFADTQSDLDSAQQKYDEAQQQLSQIASDYENVSQQLSDTLDQIYDVQNNIDDLTDRISEKQDSIDDKRDKLAKSVHDNYTQGNVGALDIVLGSKSLDDLVSNIYYFDRISDNTAKLIQSINDEKAELEADRSTLESQKADLEAVQQQQQDQLAQMQQKQQEAQDLVNSLDQQVKDLIAQRDAELLAAQQEAARAEEERKQAAAAAAAAGSSSSSSSSSSSASAGRGGNGSGSAAAVVSACNSVPSPGGGLCAMWVSQVFAAAGVGSFGGNACDMYNNYCYSSNRSDLKTGMIVAVSTHSHTSAGSIYGHVGIYVGGGVVMQNVGYINSMDIDSWCSYYGTTVSPRWGWLGGVTLS